ncbi:MAG: RNA polymerase sigma factor [Oscillospiraceae bacterium]|nr:RNA polymerase sigma factor [Oscillospiraceae bacterium]
MDDKDIVAMYFDRDEMAVSKTIEQYGAMLTRFAGKFLKDKRDVEECVNDTYSKAWNSIPPNCPDNLFAYLAKICRCTALNIIEKGSAQKRSVQLVELTTELAECLPDQSSTYSNEDNISELVNEYLRTLNKEKRAVFIGRYWYGESIAAISEKTGFSESKVKSMLHRIRGDFRKYLNEKGESL